MGRMKKPLNHPDRGAAVLVAITGGSGSGKSWLTRALKRRLGRRAGVMSLDDFYQDLADRPAAERDRVNFDEPRAIDWELFGRCLAQIRRGEPTLLPRYDFATHTRKRRPQIWRPRPVVLIDGLWLLRRPELRRLYDLMVYVDCPEAVRLARRVTRDGVERGRSRASVLRQWRAQVKPMHDRHVAPQSRRADVVVTPESFNDSLATLGKIVEKLMAIREANE